MMSVEVMIAFLIFFQIVIPSYVHVSPVSKDIFHQTNNEILEIIDDLFISIRLHKNFTKFKNVADYLSMHNFIQDVAQKNKQVYETIRNESRTKFSNKTVKFNSNIDKIIDEMIRENKIKIAQDLFNNISITVADENLIDFINLARNFNLKLNILVSDDFQLRVSDIKQQNMETRRIFNGTESTIRKYPFMASIHVEGRFSCAGSIIRSDMVITAATCLIQFMYRKSNDAFIEVRVGSDYTKKYGQLVPIADLHFHPEFHPTDLVNNVLLIELKTVLKLKKRKLLSINYDKQADKVPDNVQEVVILGWGETIPSRRGSVTQVYDQKLSQAFLNMYNLERCKTIYSKSYVTHQNFCAGFSNQGTGACKNDVGGPAIVGSTLMGVISFGSPQCGSRDSPTVFTKLGYYAKWIDSIFTRIPIKNHTGSELPESADSMEIYYSAVSKELDHGDHSFLKQQTSLSENDDTVEEYVTFKSITKLNMHDSPLESQSIFLNPNLANVPEFYEEKTEIPHVIEITSPVAKSATNKEENSLYWNFIKGIVAKLVKGTVNISKNDTDIKLEEEYIDFAFQMTSLTSTKYDNSINNIDSSTPNVPITRIGYFVDDPATEESIHYKETVKIDYELEDNSKCVNSNYPSEEAAINNEKTLNDRAEIVIMDSGTTQRFVLDKKDPKANKKFWELRENLALRNRDP